MSKSFGIFLYPALALEFTLTQEFSCFSLDKNIRTLNREVIDLLKYLRYNFGKRNKEVNKMENLTKERQLEIEDVVADLLANFGYNNEKDTCLKIIAFVRNLGFNPGNSNFDESVDSMIIIRASDLERTDTFGDKIIAVNSNRSFERKRFLIAYEFARYILNYGGERFFKHTKETSVCEENLSYFALALLMPKNSFKQYYNKLRINGAFGNSLVIQLSSEYQVALENVSQRIQDLKGLGELNDIDE